jgi:hypothetical protein
MVESLILLNPAQVCEALGIAPKNIGRLTAEGYLEVKANQQFKNGNMQLFSADQVRNLIADIPRIKQAWERYDNFRFGANRLARARACRHRSYQDKIKRKEQFFQTLDSLPGQVKQILKASFYLYHLNHYAKAGNPYLYDLKEKVLHTFVQHYYNGDELLQVSFIEGDSKLTLCPDCKTRAKNQNLSYVDYLDKTRGCPRCTREYKYYSLYEFNVCCRDYQFCFHTPYATAKRWFGKDQLPPQKQTPRREGAYAFGRAIYDSEARAVELIEVIEELQNFLHCFGIEPLIETRRYNFGQSRQPR